MHRKMLLKIFVFIILMLFLIQLIKYLNIKSFIDELRNDYERGYKEYIGDEPSYYVKYPDTVLTDNIKQVKSVTNLSSRYLFLEDSISDYSYYKTRNPEMDIELHLRIFPKYILYSSKRGNFNVTLNFEEIIKERKGKVIERGLKGEMTIELKKVDGRWVVEEMFLTNVYRQ